MTWHLIINPPLSDKDTADDDSAQDDDNPKSVLDRRGRLRHATQFIETGTDLPQLLFGHFGSRLPDGDSQILRSYVFGPSGFCTMAPLC